jgi:tripartite-type tricarboxylate transporter receptor subunit TctC
MISKRAFLLSAAGFGIALVAARMTPARAEQAYPSHPVRWIVPYAAGGATDVLSRLVCQRLLERLGRAPAAISAPRR